MSIHLVIAVTFKHFMKWVYVFFINMMPKNIIDKKTPR